jgi:hypothetical protein
MKNFIVAALAASVAAAASSLICAALALSLRPTYELATPVWRALVNSKPKASGLVRLCRWNVRDANCALHNRHLHRRFILIRDRQLV